MSQPFGSNPEFNNPFAPSGLGSEAGMQPSGTQPPTTKPTAATVFGVLNLVFGGLALLGAAMGLVMILFLREKMQELTKQPIPEPGAITWIGTGIQILLTFWLLYSGVKVLGGTMAGRSAFLQYCIGSLLIRPMIVAMNVFVQYEQMQRQLQAGGPALPPAALLGIVAAGGLFALVMAEVYEAIGFFFMRSKNVTQQFESWDRVVNSQQNNQSFNFQ